MNIETLIPTASSLGYEGFMYSIKEVEQIGSNKIKQLCGQYQVRPSAYYHRINLDSDDKQFGRQLELIARHACVAADIGSKLTIVSISPGSNSLTYNVNFQRHLMRLSKISEILEEYKIILGIEFLAKSPGTYQYLHQFIQNLSQIVDLKKNCIILTSKLYWIHIIYTIPVKSRTLMR